MFFPFFLSPPLSPALTLALYLSRALSRSPSPVLSRALSLSLCCRRQQIKRTNSLSLSLPLTHPDREPRKCGPEPARRRRRLVPATAEHHARVQNVEREENGDGQRDNDERAKDLGPGAERLVQARALGRQQPSVVGVPPAERDLCGVEGGRPPAPASAPRQREGAGTGHCDEGHEGRDEGVGGLGSRGGGVIRRGGRRRRRG